ncbi:MAG TPA: FAD-dependent monooxygenase [Chryseosolibacter sp.]|nr:FAD-dependent monooxygenase [Chryseosolibacter sp.]
MNHDNIAIVGGGIGGLTLAIALQRKGLTVKVFEGAPKIQPLGAGLVLAANAVKGFVDIGIGDAVLRAGKVLKVLRIKDARGRVLTETDSEKIAAKFGVINNFTIHRADLHEVLIDQLLPGTLELNKRLVDLEQGPVTELKFSDGTNTLAAHVIACDGIHSVVRKKLLPETQPRYAGYTCWRGVIDNLPPGTDPDETCETWGRGSRFGIVPLSKNRVYWFACLNARANDERMKSFKNEDLLRYFGHFHKPVPRILESTPSERIIWNDIIDLQPLKKFAFGNILLMGDAAHATTPNMGQGACMAIEDAAVLARCVEESASIPEAFQQFEKKRIERTTAIVNKSWTLGKMAQLENRFLIGLRNMALKLTPHSVTENQIKFLIHGS